LPQHQDGINIWKMQNGLILITTYVRQNGLIYLMMKVNTEKKDFPAKLKSLKFNRPEKDSLNNKILTCGKLVSSKLRNLKPLAINLYNKKNNLSQTLRNGLEELMNAVRDRQIVICRTAKDGKIVIANYQDYNRIMTNELASFSRLSDVIAILSLLCSKGLAQLEMILL